MLLLKRLCQSIGLASLILVMNYGDLLGGGADVRMHVPFGLAPICLAQIAGILLLGLGIFLIIALLERTRFSQWAGLVLAIVVPPYLLLRLRELIPSGIGDGLIVLFAVAWAAMLLLLLLNFPRGYRRFFQMADAIGVVLAIFACCSIAQLLWLTRWKPGAQQLTAAWESKAQPTRQHPLVVWIVFDELSYDQLFGHRAHDLALPNFDALRSQSTLFTDVQPIGMKTVKILPSLLSGHVIDDYRYSFQNKLKVHFTGQPGWHSLSGSQTIFADAEQQGWRTALVGWYNPYCSLYGSAIGDCYWTNYDMLDGPVAQDKSFWSNTVSPLRQMGEELASPEDAGRDNCTYNVLQRHQTHIDLQQHAFQLLHTGQADFVFLHLAIPHSPNIWSRLSGTYATTCGSSYLDNLALADRVMGQILGVLQQSPRWKDTTIVVEGDHSWRVMLWDWLPAWTDEDERASKDDFDTRPALLIHAAGQTTPETVAEPWSLVRVHDAVEQVLHGQALHF